MSSWIAYSRRALSYKNIPADRRLMKVQGAKYTGPAYGASEKVGMRDGAVSELGLCGNKTLVTVRVKHESTIRVMRSFTTHFMSFLLAHIQTSTRPKSVPWVSLSEKGDLNNSVDTH